MFKKFKQNSKTIALLIDWISGNYHRLLLYGIMDCVQKNGYNFICFRGTGIQETYEYEIQRNIVYTKANDYNIDGIIFSAGSLGTFVGGEKIETFISQFSNIPHVCIDRNVVGVPSYLIDNKTGMGELMTHLLNDHKYKKPAFISGHPGNIDVPQRYEIYIEYLTKYNIPVEESRIVYSDFTYNAGMEAVKILFDNRKADCDVIIAINDDVALGAMDELYRRGINVPYDIAVVGFDDIENAQYARSPLTTVSDNVYNRGWNAASGLINLLQGQDVPMEKVSPSRLIVRESCGCLPSQITHLLPGHKKDADKDPHSRDRPVTLVYEETVERIRAHEGLKDPGKKFLKNLHLFYEELFSGFREDRECNYFKTWAIMTEELIEHNKNNYVEQLLSIMRSVTLGAVATEYEVSLMEDRFYVLMVMLYHKMLNRKECNIQQAKYDQDRLIFLYDNLSINTVEQLVENLNINLPNIGIKQWYLVLYEADNGNQPPMAKLVSGYDHNGPVTIPENGIRFLSNILIPKKYLSNEHPCTMILEPLYYSNVQLGYILIELLKENVELYDTIRRSLSSALRGVLLTAELAKK